MALEIPLLRVEWAEEHIRNLSRASDALFASGAYGLVVAENSKAQQRRLRIVPYDPLPPHFGLRIGDAIHNLRSALDLATWEIVSPLNPRNPEQVQFPFVKKFEGPQSLERAIENRGINLASKNIIQAFRESRPYDGGNKDLFGLHILDIADKHKLLVPAITILSINKLDLGAIDPGNMPNASLIGGRVRPNKEGHLPFFWTFKPGSPPINQNAVINASFGIMFDTGLHFDGEMVVPTLVRIATEVRRTIDHIRSAVT
ncbi:MAG TPA: hypothetical protein VHD15_01670 [Hyphomicrobiales bacterium]|nr:hypothetical protein [Hyphomicrobiales bacterium]